MANSALHRMRSTIDPHDTSNTIAFTQGHVVFTISSLPPGTLRALDIQGSASRQIII